MIHPESYIAQSVKELPQKLPIFPLEGVLLLPGGQLPLNVFEKHYLRMVEDALSDSRLIGIIQPSTKRDKPSDQSEGHSELDIFDTGCAGRITSFSETSDGRYEVVLTGVCRFQINQVLEKTKGYRRVEAKWDSFTEDLNQNQRQCLNIDRDKLYALLDNFFEMHDLSCSWDSIKATPDSSLITALSMICPLAPSEKQCLLEAEDCEKRAEMFMTMLELATHQKGLDTQGSSDQQH